MFEEIQSYLSSLGLPQDDSPDLPSSTQAFADGGGYKWEIAGALSAQHAELLLEELHGHGLRLNQITQTVGVMRLLDAEISALVSIAREHQLQLVLAVGPRGTYDIGAQKLAHSPAAQASAFRLRGMKQVVRAIEDIRRAANLGVRGFLIFDEGLLWLLSRWRADGRLPGDLRFKASSALGVSNPLHCRVIADLGADSINLQRDLDLGMIAAARQAVRVPFDLHTDNPISTGGFVRAYDVPEMVRVGAPVYLKTGNAAQEIDETHLSAAQISLIAHQLAVDREMIQRMLPDAKQSTLVEY